MLKTTCATIALIAINVSLANTALAAGCASAADADALKTAVMQQELMVAALQCHEAGAYNRFVLAYRPELQSSDATLKAFFVRRGGEHGEAGYDTFKTKAANLSALEQARDGRSFCADAHALFSATLENHGTLASFVETRSATTDVGSICLESRPAPVLAVADKPAVMQKARPVLVKVADARADVAVGGVPEHALPVNPYRREDAAPPPQQQDDQAAFTRDDARNQQEEEEARPAYANADQDDLPPPRPRYYQISRRTDDRGDGYAARSYGPPQGWRDAPAPRWSWYDRDDYGQ
jgi:hypothetical protein